MNLSEIPALLVALTPEILLGFLAFAVLLVDAALVKVATVERRHETVAWISLVGLAVTVVALLLQVDCSINLGGGAYVASRLIFFFKAVLCFLAMVTLLVGVNLPFSRHAGESHALVIFSLLGMFLLASAENLLMIFLALEMTSLPLYALTASQKGARRSLEAGLKYLIYGGLSAAFLLFGFSYIYGATGHLDLQGIRETLADGGLLHGGTGLLVGVGLLLVMAGLGFKIAAAPFHFWAPDAYEGAPVPVAALVASGVKLASVLVMVRLLFGGLLPAAGCALAWPSGWRMGWVVVAVLMAVLSMVLGNVAALRQRNVKRLLAYSSVAHAGYLLVGISAVTAEGRPAEAAISSILYYVVVYALANVGAFGALLVLASSVGGDDLDDLRGVALRAPIPSFLLLVFLLSLAGIPPMAGFFGKFYLFAAAIQADPHNFGLLWLVVLAVGMSALSLYYYLRVAKTMYVEAADDPRPIPCPPAAGGALVVLGFLVVLLGAFPSGLLGVLQMPHAAREPVLAARVPPADLKDGGVMTLPTVNPRLTAIEHGR